MNYSALDAEFQCAPLTKLHKSPEELRESHLQTPYELELSQSMVLGAIAPPYGSVRGRAPWNPNFPPYYVSKEVPASPADASVDAIYSLMANATEYNRQTTTEHASRARTHFARHRAAPLWNAFTDEVVVRDPHGPSRRTDRVGFSWMPRNPTDSDWNEAGLIAKSLPRDPELFAPDGYYMTAPGLPFRYGGI